MFTTGIWRGWSYLVRYSRKKQAIFLIPVIVFILLVLWIPGVIGIWTEGIPNIAYNTEDFTDTKGHIVEGEYSVSIDLSNMESNIGKDLYNDGNHRIYVSWIDNTGVDTGGFRIGFRSSGNYSLKNASLISGIHHATVDENSFTSNMSAKMTATYNGRSYNSSVFGISGLNYKDGDDFSFYIFPAEAYEKEEILLNEKGIVKLIVKDLYKNIWSKK